MNKKVYLRYLIFVALLSLGGFFYWFLEWKDKAYTDDAYVQGNQIVLTPLRSGFVRSILTDDTFLVKKGDLLIELDETDAKIALQAAKENLALKVREVCQSFHDVFALQADIEAKKAEYIKSAQDFEHRLYVLPEGGVSMEEYEHAQAALRTSFFSLQKTEILLEKALSFVRGTSIKNHPEVIKAKDNARQAFVDLYRCKIYSPAEGLVAQRTVQVGMWTPQGQPLLSVIPLDQIWVNANFKETQMKRMKIGQMVRITSDLYGKEVVFQGKIIGLPGGAGNVFSLLPPQNLSGNWIKIVQRLPVRVVLDQEDLIEHPLRLGLSMEATVNLKGQGQLIPKTTKGSPSYRTDIFDKEESGDMAWIDEIIDNNLDPLLSEFISEPLIWK